MSCPICGDQEGWTIRLPLRPEPSAMFDQAQDEPSSSRPSSREYPCPECRTVPVERVMHLREISDVEMARWPELTPELIFERHGARQIAEWLVKRNGAVAVETRNCPERPVTQIRWTLGIVMPADSGQLRRHNEAAEENLLTAQRDEALVRLGLLRAEMGDAAFAEGAKTFHVVANVIWHAFATVVASRLGWKPVERGGDE